MTAPAISTERAAIGARLRAARKAAGLTQAEAGVRLDVTYAAISDLERGISVYPLKRLEALAALYGVPLAALYGDAPAQNGHALAIPPPLPVADEALDPELEALIACYEALAPTGSGARRRILRYLRTRLDITVICPTCHKEF